MPTVEQKEFIDEQHPVEKEFKRLLERYEEYNFDELVSRLREFISRDPYFFHPYSQLAKLYVDENPGYTRRLLKRGYRKAIKRITDKKGNWPDLLLWVHEENRHIIWLLITKAVNDWDKGDPEKAEEIMQKIMNIDPYDGANARFHLLGLKEGMSYDSFFDRFVVEGNLDTDKVEPWFQKHAPDYPEEFEEWI